VPGCLGVRARGEGGTEELVELGLELESDSGAGEEKAPTGGALLPAPERERESGGGGVHAGLGRRASCGPVRERERAGEGKGGEARALGHTGWAGPSGEKREKAGLGCKEKKTREGGRKEKRARWAGPKGGKEREHNRKEKNHLNSFEQ
jgi:hypothetical protein